MFGKKKGSKEERRGVVEVCGPWDKTIQDAGVLSAECRTLQSQIPHTSRNYFAFFGFAPLNLVDHTLVQYPCNLLYGMYVHESPLCGLLLISSSSLIIGVMPLLHWLSRVWSPPFTVPSIHC
jgi:hypothetical protein